MMLEANFNWIGEGFNYGQKVKFFCVTKEGVELIYIVYKTTSFSDEFFKIERVHRSAVSVNIIREIEEPILGIFIIKTDDEFRKKFKRSYYLLKIITETQAITIGAYTDNDRKVSPDNLYLLCDSDFINILTRIKKVEFIGQIVGTVFEPLKVLFDKKELALELLRN
jgi:hypothetical protein